MPKQVTEVDTLQEYIAGVMQRAEHHAPGIAEIILALAGAVVWKKDSIPLHVNVREGEMTNVLWAHIGGKRYAFSYNHAANSVEMREGSTQGPPRETFTNDTPLTRIKQVFASL